MATDTCVNCGDPWSLCCCDNPATSYQELTHNLQTSLSAANAKIAELEQDAAALASALDGMSYEANIALPQIWHDYMKRQNAAMK